MLMARICKVLLVIALLLLLVGWFQFTPDRLLGKADAVGYAVCHRIPSHSFSLQGRPLALCARCSGQYLGWIFGVLYLGLLGGKRSGRPAWWVLVLMGVSVAAFTVDGMNSLFSFYPETRHLSLYSPRNAFRLISGMGVGLSISILVVLLFNRVSWSAVSTRPVLTGWRRWTGFFGGGVVVSAGVLSGAPAVLYPLTVLSALGVLVLLTALYSLLWVIVLGKENSYQDLGAMGWVLLGGFATAVLQIALMDLLRFWVTGTWSGIHLG